MVNAVFPTKFVVLVPGVTKVEARLASATYALVERYMPFSTAFLEASRVAAWGEIVQDGSTKKAIISSSTTS